jgi:FkbM family methyltransferase
MPRNQGLKFRILRRVAKAVQKYQPVGIDRVLRTIYSPDARQRDHFEAVIAYDGDLLIEVNTASFIEWSIFFYGYYQREVSGLIRQLVKPGDVAIDVGANIGCQTLIMGKSAGHSGRVIAIEPHPTIFARLTHNIHLNSMENVQTLQCGLSDAAGESTLYIAPEEYPNQGMSSLYHQAALSLEVQVPIRTLDGLLQAQKPDRLDLIKIDTQGNDYKVLLGGERSIREFRPYLIFEYDEVEWGRSEADFAACEAFFRRQQYTLYVLDVTGSLIKTKHGVPKSANILAVPPGT